MHKMINMAIKIKCTLSSMKLKCVYIKIQLPRSFHKIQPIIQNFLLYLYTITFNNHFKALFLMHLFQFKHTRHKSKCKLFLVENPVLIVIFKRLLLYKTNYISYFAKLSRVARYYRLEIPTYAHEISNQRTSLIIKPRQNLIQNLVF